MAKKHIQFHLSEMEPLALVGELATEFDGAPDIRFLLKNENANTGDFCFFRCIFPPGASHNRHTHPNTSEFLYVVRGTAAAGTDDEEHVAVAGTAIYSPKGSIHWIRNLSETEELEFVGGYGSTGDLEAAGYESIGPISEQYRQAQNKA